MSASQTDTAPQRPPFANHIDLDDPMVMIYCGRRAWALAKPGAERVASLVFPRNRDPGEFSWPVLGKQVLVLRCDEEVQKIRLLVIELLRQGARQVSCYLADEELTIYDHPDA